MPVWDGRFRRPGPVVAGTKEIGSVEDQYGWSARRVRERSRDPLPTEFPPFVRVAVAILHDEERAADAVQEAFATAVRRRRRFRGDGALEAWVWRIVVNSARRAAVREPREGLPEEWSDEQPSAVADIRAAVVRLPERQRLALFLRYYADLDYDAIAAALGVSVGTVGATLNAARANLRGLLEEVPS